MARTRVFRGQQVQVDLSGLQAGQVALGSGVSAVGKVVDVDEAKQTITVHLGVSIEGHDRVAVAPERVVALAQDAVGSDLGVPA
jgi:hypothetical protein